MFVKCVKIQRRSRGRSLRETEGDGTWGEGQGRQEVEGKWRKGAGLYSLENLQHQKAESGPWGAGSGPQRAESGPRGSEANI